MAYRDSIPVGSKFNHLTVVKEVERQIFGGQTKRSCLVRCDCGKEVVFIWYRVKIGRNKTCGCSVDMNQWEIFGDVAKMSRNGRICIIDADDVCKVRDMTFGLANGYWTANKNGRVSLHGLIYGSHESECIDHINGDTSDNRKANLRECTKKQNSRNAAPRKNCSSKYKGVHAHGSGWRAAIRVDRKAIHLGTFKNEIDAAKAYDDAAKKYYGAFARTNF